MSVMARIKNGILGGFSGKAGAVIGYEVRGKSFIRGLPRITNKTPSIKQLASRAKFKLLQNWRSQLTDFFAISFRNHTRERSAQNAAHHFNSKIIKGEYPNFEIDYPSIVISAGTLPGLSELEMRVTNKQLNISWKANAIGEAKYGDLIALLVCYEQHSYYQGELSLANRQVCKCDLELIYPPECTLAHVYITVISNDREKAANSVYLGQIIL